ncbi:hypothetical protein BCR44DRAFT_1441471 [Catenaria anguillulae PL171]|uniref:Uncharacterized protein n=1 Tax=Catenaria anguillulae PL171 TaxID=765915 RepID=A0A1Y2HB87_9FUNG|nr:hypothetical protein BCR44DRAFT_1441471 [Catenaria anguillulae PL171]
MTDRRARPTSSSTTATATGTSASPTPSQTTAHPSPITTLTALASQGLLKPTVVPAVAACLDLDDSELIVADLVEEILQRSQDVLFEKHISSQVLPYAIQYAKDTVLKLAMWEFFDEDRVDPADAMWSPDQEPDPLPFDSWARGVLSPLLPSPSIPSSEHATTTAAHSSSALDDPERAHAPTLTLVPGLPAHKPIVPWNSVAGSQDLFDSLQMDIAPAASTSPSGRPKLTAEGQAVPPQWWRREEGEQPREPASKVARAPSRSPTRPKAGDTAAVRSPARRLVQMAS